MNPLMLEVYHRWSTCRACRLHATRDRYVHGRGNSLSATLLLLGEAPGRDENEVGLPFIGRAGHLLREVMEEVGVAQVRKYYITNTVACWPINNRTPKSDEVAACRSRLNQILSVLPVRVIATLGHSAAKTMLGESIPGMLSLRGSVHRITIGDPERGVFVYPMVHPSYVIRKGSKGAVREQFTSDLRAAHLRSMKRPA